MVVGGVADVAAGLGAAGDGVAWPAEPELQAARSRAIVAIATVLAAEAVSRRRKRLSLPGPGCRRPR